MDYLDDERQTIDRSERSRTPSMSQTKVGKTNATNRATLLSQSTKQTNSEPNRQTTK